MSLINGNTYVLCEVIQATNSKAHVMNIIWAQVEAHNAKWSEDWSALLVLKDFVI